MTPTAPCMHLNACGNFLTGLKKSMAEQLKTETVDFAETFRGHKCESCGSVVEWFWEHDGSLPFYQSQCCDSTYRMYPESAKIVVDNWLADISSPKEIWGRIFLICSDGSYYGISDIDIDRYRKKYNHVDLDYELRSMSNWCRCNPGKRKTRHGIPSFVSRWLERAQKKNKPKKAKSQTLFD